MKPALGADLHGMRGQGTTCRLRLALFGVAVAAAASVPVHADDVLQRRVADAGRAAALSGRSVEIVTFADRRHAAVRLLRGLPGPSTPPSAQVVSFGIGRAEEVTILRGIAAPTAPAPIRQASLAPETHIEKISFGDGPLSTVTVMRGSAARGLSPVGLFGPASEGELDRIAFAVDGVESRHGADSRMWRPKLDAPQGPMQVSAAAALDVGGGDRFDLRQNRLLGRAYLAQMYHRYGNWPDALAGYNWGPVNVDQWIAAGRPAERLPIETQRYIARVLRDALIKTASGWF